MKCLNCGTINKDDSKYCSRCGQALPDNPPSTLGDEHEQEWVAKAFGGKYQIIREIGRGGMAIVYEAFDIALDRKVAVKVLPKQFAFDDEFVKRFEKEAKIAAKLDHPNIVKIYDIGQQGEIHYFVMNYLSGETLKERIHHLQHLTIQEIDTISEQICKALSYAHEKGIIHRDLKPSNIIFDALGSVVLMDFGIAYAAFGTKITSTGTQMGTPHYMSPEQASGEVCDHRADLYSFGIILFEMTTGEVPFQADSSLAVLHKQIYEKPRNPAELNQSIPSWLVDITLKCLNKDRDARYQSADEILADFEKGKHGGVTTLEEVPKEHVESIASEPLPIKDKVIVDKPIVEEAAKTITDSNKQEAVLPKTSVKVEKGEVVSKIKDEKAVQPQAKKTGSSMLIKIGIGGFVIIALPIIILLIWLFSTGILYFE